VDRLKNGTLRPVAQLFIDLREVADAPTAAETIRFKPDMTELRPPLLDDLVGTQQKVRRPRRLDDDAKPTVRREDRAGRPKVAVSLGIRFDKKHTVSTTRHDSEAATLTSISPIF
jgi:hypothetical protein